MQRAKDDPGVEKFLEYFYKSCVDILLKPFGDIPEFKQLQSETHFQPSSHLLMFARRNHPPHVEGTDEFVPLPLRSDMWFRASAFFPQSFLPPLL